MWNFAVEVIWPLARMAIVAQTAAQRLVLFFVCLLAATVGATSCPISNTATGGTKPLYLLTLVPFPESKDKGWSNGLGTISGARVARDEINKRTDLLPGYHIELIVQNIEACSLTEATIGTVNLIKYTVHSPCSPVVGVIGLLCSTHTSLISPLAGHEGINLIQMSIANSPIFETTKNSFPHLWRVLGSGIVYVDAAVKLMDELEWKRVAVIYDHGSAYYSRVALQFEKAIQNESDKEIVFIDAILGKNTLQLHQIASRIKNQAATVLFVALSDYQSAELLCLLKKERLYYPSYIWLQVGRILDRILEAGKILNLCAEEDILSVKEGHIGMQIQSAQSNHSEILVSGNNYASFIDKYLADLEKVNKTYSPLIIKRDLIFSNLMYDEVWALALAINDSLPVLDSKNLSIDSYTIGQKTITALIEEQLANVKFQGASGLIEFNANRGVIATVNIYQVLNSREIIVGSFVPDVVDSHHMVVRYNLSIDIDRSNIPTGQPELRDVVIPLPVAIILNIATAIVLVFTTVVFILLVYYREWPEVKATSPYLSVVMLIGCYLLTFGIIFRTTYNRFWHLWSNDHRVYSFLVTMDSFCSSTGLILLVITVFFKLLRVHHFFSYMTLKLRQMWRTCSMILLILVLSLWIGVGFIAIAIGMPIQPQFLNISVIEGNILVIYRYLEYPGMVKRYLDLATALYVAIFLILIVYLAIRTRNIEQKQFKDTKKLNVFVTLLIVAVVSQVAISEILHEENWYWVSILLTSFISLFIPLSVFIVLLLPKLIPSMRKPKPRRRPSRRLSRQRSSGFSVKNALYNMNSF